MARSEAVSVIQCLWRDPESEGCAADERPGELFSYVDLEARVRRDHPLRRIRAIVNEALAVLERDLAGFCCNG